jgi:predicted glycosyltransferase
MRVWVDMTASAHVLVFRPLLERLRARGAEVEVTARDYSQTLELLELHGIEATVVGSHGGRSRLAKATSMFSRLRELRRWARGRRFDIALAHGSHELTMTARRLGLPSSTTFDYEYAWLQHQLGCRAAAAVVVPEAIPPKRLERYGVTPSKLGRYPGLKEEYYLADFEPDPRVLDDLGVDRQRVLVVVRTPPDVSLYHRHANQLFPTLLSALGNDDRVQAVVVPRTRTQFEGISRLELPSLHVVERAIDAQSLIALADLVVSAGGTMNREAAALGVPVYTTYGGRLGAVDEELIRQRRLLPLADPLALALVKRDDSMGMRERRDPGLLLDLLLAPLHRRAGGPSRA